MKKILLLIIGLSFFGASASAQEFVYPFQEISKPKCRFQKFSTLSSSCKQKLPKLKTSDYDKYKNDYNYRRIYTVLWGATYKYGWDVGNGSHLGVDFATSEGTPVYSITNGKVTYAGWKNGWGNVVTIKHRVNGKTIYSGYSHLSKINVKVGQNVPVNQKIGEVGSTGNSTGNHLHFQLDTNEDTRNHPYYYYKNCPGNEWNIVNEGKCRTDLQNNTIDPLRFLETNGAIIKGGKIDKDAAKPKSQRVDPSTLVTTKQINDREVTDFIRDHKINFEFNLGGTVPKGGQVKGKLTIVSKRTGRPFNGRLPENMTFRANKDLVNIFPNKMMVVDKGERDVTLTGLKVGKTSLYVDIGSKNVYNKQLYIYNPSNKITPAGVLDKSPYSVYLGNEQKGYFYFLDNEKTPLIDIPYGGEYKVIATNGKLCPFNNVAENLELEYSRVCGLGTLVSEMTFTYGGTNHGILIFGARPSSTGGMRIKIINNKTKKVLLEKVVKAKIPKQLSSYHTYYSEIIDMLERAVINGIDGYYKEDWELDERDAYAFTRNLIIYKRNKLKGIDNRAYELLNNALKEINKKKGRLNKKITREEFLNIVTTFVPLAHKGNAIKFKDLDAIGNERANKVFNKSYTWKDKFGNNYFQSDKNITRAEAAYMLYQAYVNKTYTKDL